MMAAHNLPPHLAAGQTGGLAAFLSPAVLGSDSDTDPWTNSHAHLGIPQAEIDYIRTIKNYEIFSKELETKIKASKNEKKIRKILQGVDAPLKKLQSFAVAVNVASRQSTEAQSAIWGSLLVALTYPFDKTEYLEIVVEFFTCFANALPTVDPYLSFLGQKPPAKESKEVTELKEIQESFRHIWLDFTGFTDTTALMIWLKLRFTSSMPLGAVSRRIMQASTFPFFKKTLREDCERDFERLKQDVHRFERLAQGKEFMKINESHG